MRKFSGSALFITVGISLIIGIFCSLLILLAYNNLRFEKMTALDQRLQRDLRSAIDMVLADTSILLGKQQTRDLFGEGRDSVSIRTDNWGLFGLATIEAQAQGRQRSRSFFFGQSPDTLLDGCLYLPDHKIPVSLVGNAKLRGNAYLPKGGLRPGFIDQRGFAFATLIEGQESPSADSMPAVDLRLMERLARRDTGRAPGLIPDTLDRSFSDTAFTIYQKGAIDLSGIELKGHILIESDSLIRVLPGAHLENVILSAPLIEMEEGFEGRVQAVATDSIIVRSNCRLHYPSALVLVKLAASTIQPEIRIGDSCSLEGVVVAYSARPEDIYKTRVDLGQHCSIRGFLYVSGFISMQGAAVQGAVMADYLFYSHSASILENFLVDASIDRKSLSGYFIGPHLFANERPQRIMQWLY